MLVFLWIMVYCIVRHLVRRKYVLLCNKNEFTYYKAKILLNNSKKQTGGGGKLSTIWRKLLTIQLLFKKIYDLRNLFHEIRGLRCRIPKEM